MRILVRMVDHSEDDFTGEAADLVLGSKKVEARASALEEDNYRVHAALYVAGPHCRHVE